MRGFTRSRRIGIGAGSVSATYHRDGRDYTAGRDPDPALWEDDWETPQRPRKGVVRSVFGLLKFAVFLAPLAYFLYGSFIADCRGRQATGWVGFLGAGACARNEILGSAVSMPDNLGALKRLID